MQGQTKRLRDCQRTLGAYSSGADINMIFEESGASSNEEILIDRAELIPLFNKISAESLLDSLSVKLSLVCHV